MRAGVLPGGAGLERTLNITLVRHTRPDVAAGICYGQSDIDVGENFEKELERLRAKLAEIIPFPSSIGVYSSPLQRCLKLARAYAGGLPIIEDARLMELDFGDWELARWEDIPRGLLDEWADDHVMQAPPNGESFHALSLRAQDFLQQVSANPATRDLLVFTHAGVIRALLSQALNLRLADTFRLQVDYGGVSRIVLENGLLRTACVNC